MSFFLLQDWLGTWSAPIWLTPGPGVLGRGLCRTSQASRMDPGAEEPPASLSRLSALPGRCFCSHLCVASGEGFPSLGGFTD